MLKIQQDVWFALRMLGRSKRFAIVAVLMLAFAIGATTALYSVVDAVLLRPFGYDRPGHLVKIGGINRQGQQTGVSASDFLEIQHRARSFERTALARVQAFTLAGPREPVNVYGQLVSQDCFRIL